MRGNGLSGRVGAVCSGLGRSVVGLRGGTGMVQPGIRKKMLLCSSQAHPTGATLSYRRRAWHVSGAEERRMPPLLSRLESGAHPTTLRAATAVRQACCSVAALLLSVRRLIRSTVDIGVQISSHVHCTSHVRYALYLVRYTSGAPRGCKLHSLSTWP